jgi:hypothetical protein
MNLHLFPVGGSKYMEYALGVDGGWLWLNPGSRFDSFCYGSGEMEYLDFLHKEDLSLFEVHNRPGGDESGAKVESGRDEPSVHECFPYTFYITGPSPGFSSPSTGIDTLHCYPRNVLHEFTFMVYGIEGAGNVGSSRGSVSGMYSSYYPSTGLPGNVSTVHFRRALAIDNGRFPDSFSWQTGDTLQRVSVPGYGSIPVHPGWFPPGWAHPTTGWTGGWIVGAFSVFGPVPDPGLQNQLTVECFSHAHYSYIASWGYWEGRWEETVHRQLMGALGYFEGCPPEAEPGSAEAQASWRRHNGGFDIVLYNDGRLVIPPDIGLDVRVPGWDGVTVPLD